MMILYKTSYSRKEAESSPSDMYIFTDTLQRSSGHGGVVDKDSWYSKEYLSGTGLLALLYPESTTTSVIRGLPNAYPICIAKLMWTKIDKWEGGLWDDTVFTEFTETVKPEINRILENLKNYKRLVLPWPGLTDRKGSSITKDRCPLCWAWLSTQISKILDYAKNI